MTIWNAARAASKRPLPKPRKVHAPVYGLAGNGFPLDRDGACRDCGHHMCSCDRDWFNEQEAQRAALARTSPQINGKPAVQQHLRQGDPRRMSLGHNERDYDQSRRATIDMLSREWQRIQLAVANREVEHSAVADRLNALDLCILEHQNKLPSHEGTMKCLPNEAVTEGIGADGFPWRSINHVALRGLQASGPVVNEKLAIEKVYESNSYDDARKKVYESNSSLFGINATGNLYGTLARAERERPLFVNPQTYADLQELCAEDDAEAAAIAQIAQRWREMAPADGTSTLTRAKIEDAATNRMLTELGKSEPRNVPAKFSREGLYAQHMRDHLQAYQLIADTKPK